MERPLIVDVYSHDTRLRQALVAQLHRAGGVAARPVDGDPWESNLEPSSCRPTAVVGPAKDLTIAICKRLAATGAKVIVLAPVPRDAERRDYAAAGAYAYLEMAVDNRELLTHIAALAELHRDGSSAG